MTVSNIGIQLFTYDASRRCLQVLRLLEPFITDFEKARATWLDHDGSRKSAPVARFFSAPSCESRLFLNECQIQIPKGRYRTVLGEIAVQKLKVHLSVSPNSEVWLKSADTIASGRPVVRKVISGVVSLEKAALYRSPDPMPSSLEMTLYCAPTDVCNLLETLCDTVKKVWSQIDCTDKFGTMDFGGEWLFFPTSGYNPNVSNIYAYYCNDARTDWPRWRELHNVSFESITELDSGTMPQALIHSFSAREPVWPQS
jgi:hypothetical protein